MPAYLEREYGRRRGRNPRYSLRAFARDLGCDHSTLSQWMRRTRPMTEEAAHQLCDALQLTGADRNLAREIDENDMTVLLAIQSGAAPNANALANATALAGDQVKLSLFKLLRLAVLRMDGPTWHLTEREVQ
ncbi:MAG: helix-turn-helix transcriptional regulator [Sphingomonas sp.]